MGMFGRKSPQSGDPSPDPNEERSARRTLTGRFGSLVQRSGDLVAGVAGTVKDVARSPILKQALDARARGNLAAAFHLAREEHALHPDDEDGAAAFWDIAVAYERPGAAVDAATGLIRRHATEGALELAAQYWVELHGCLADALLEPATFARLIPQLSAQVEADRAAAQKPGRGGSAVVNGPTGDSAEDAESTEALHRARADALLAALRGVVDERNVGLTAGLAFRVAELARALDPPTALRAARFAVDIEELHEAKRERLRALIAELAPGTEPAPIEAPAEALASPAPPRSAAAPVDPDAGAFPEPQLVDEPTPDEIETAGIAEDDPARNHPARAVSPPPMPLSEDELASLQARLPPSRSPLPANGGITDPGRPGSDDAGAASPEASIGKSAVAFDVPPEEPVVDGRPAPVQVSAGGSALFPDIKVVTGEFSCLEADRIELVVSGGRRVVIGLDQVQAIAVAEVAGLDEAPVVVVDLVLNWRELDDAPLRAVRMRGAGLPSSAPEEGKGDPGDALRSLLAGLMERTRAIPLPDPDAALGLMIPAYASLAEYEREVLQIAR